MFYVFLVVCDINNTFLYRFHYYYMWVLCCYINGGGIMEVHKDRHGAIYVIANNSELKLKDDIRKIALMHAEETEQIIKNNEMLIIGIG